MNKPLLLCLPSLVCDTFRSCVQRQHSSSVFSARMVRILVAGDVEGKLDMLFDRVSALHNSKNGPFDMLFVLGSFYPLPAADATAFEDYLCGTKEAPIPTYFIEAPSASAEKAYGAVTAGDELCANIKYLGAGGMEVIGKLTVAFLAAQHTEEDKNKVMKLATASSTFLGADLLLTTEWGQGGAAGYDLSEVFGRRVDGRELGCADVADVAATVRPRYHFAATHGVFFQRPPYRNHAEVPQHKTSHVTRFISLASVSQSKEKSKKWLHAIAIEAIPYMTKEALVEEPADCTNSPYDAFAAKRPADTANDGGLLKRPRVAPGGISEEAMLRIANEEDTKRADAGMFFWGGGGGGGGRGGGGRGGGRGGRGGDRDRAPREVDPNNTSIFVGGLPEGYNPQRLSAAFAHYGEVLNVRAPPNKDFAFVEFQTHAQAQAAIDSKGITLGAQGVKIGWSTARAPQQPREGGRGGGGFRPLPPANDDEATCWFCLSSPKADLDMVVSIGEEIYMAIPKGPLSPEHLLLMPIAHCPAMSRLSASAWGELERYKTALKGLYAKKGCVPVLFERRLETRGARHTHMQVIPVPEAKAAEVRDAFEARATAIGAHFETVPPGQNLPELRLSDGQQYFYAEVPGLGGKGTARLLYRMGPGDRLPLQFGRDAMAELLGCPEKVDWKKCELSKDDELRMVENLKADFAPLDPALEG